MHARSSFLPTVGEAFSGKIHRISGGPGKRANRSPPPSPTRETGLPDGGSWSRRGPAHESEQDVFAVPEPHLETVLETLEPELSRRHTRNLARTSTGRIPRSVEIVTEISERNGQVQGRIQGTQISFEQGGIAELTVVLGDFDRNFSPQAHQSAPTQPEPSADQEDRRRETGPGRHESSAEGRSPHRVLQACLLISAQLLGAIMVCNDLVDGLFHGLLILPRCAEVSRRKRASSR